jgi:hypothetical protein
MRFRLKTLLIIMAIVPPVQSSHIFSKAAD